MATTKTSRRKKTATLATSPQNGADPKEAELAKAGNAALEWATALVVADEATFQHASDGVKRLAHILDQIDDLMDPIVKANYAAWKVSTGQKKKLAEPLQAASTTARHKLGAYLAEQEKARAQQEYALRMAAIAEEEKLRAEEVKALEAEGKNREAEALKASPVDAPAIVLSTPAPQAEGVYSVTVWKFRITSEADVPLEYRTVDERKIGAVVRALKDQTRIPGVEVYAEESVRVRDQGQEG
jgi:hypothetical protein